MNHSRSREEINDCRTLSGQGRAGWGLAILFVRGLAVLFPIVAEAQYQRHIESVLPRAGQQGTTVPVVVQGLHLERPQEFLFYRRGIHAVIEKSLPDLTQFDEKGNLNPVDKRTGNRSFGALVQQQFLAQFTIAPDCPIGLHPFKVRTANQLTTLSTFWVTPYPIQKEAELFERHTNETPDHAELITEPNASVLGYIIPGPIMDRDVYRVFRQKGERISVEVNCVRVSQIWWAREELDLVVRVLDAKGNELAESDDSAMFVQDPMLSVIAPEDGEYFIEIAQSIFSSAYNSFYQHYLVHIGNFEQPQAVYPAGGPPGKSLDVTLIGDSKGDRKTQIHLPEVIGDFNYSPDSPSTLSMRVTRHRNVLEEGSHPTEAGEFPAALNGIISRPNETDEFRFQAKKRSSYRIRVFSRSLGTPLDPYLEIVNQESGQVEVAADDVGNYEERGLPGVPRSFRRLEVMDPSIVWSPKRDGTYLLRIRDAQNQGGTTYVYRVEVEPVENRVDTYLFSRNYARESTADTGLVIPQGGRCTVRIGLTPGQGNLYRDDLELFAEGLPQGVEMVASTIRAVDGKYPSNVPVQFVAEPGVEPLTALVRVLARPVDSATPFESRAGQSFLFVGDHFGQASNSLILDQYALAVTEPAPFSIEIEPPVIPLTQNGELTVNVKLKRRMDFDQPLLIGSIWNPPGIGSEPMVEVPAGVDEVKYRYTAAADAPPADWLLAIKVVTLPRNPKDVAGTGQTAVSSEMFNLSVAKPYVKLASEPQSIRRGSRIPFVWKVSHVSPFRHDATTRLLGLPTGIRVIEPTPVLKSNSETLTFELEANQEALLGQYKEISVELTFREDGQETRNRSGASILRVDPAFDK